MLAAARIAAKCVAQSDPEPMAPRASGRRGVDRLRSFIIHWLAVIDTGKQSDCVLVGEVTHAEVARALTPNLTV